MINFYCSACQAEIQSDYPYVGEVAECPLCKAMQIVPDPPLLINSSYFNYNVKAFKGSSMLWNLYSVSRDSAEGSEGKDSFLKIPTSFFTKHSVDFPVFVNSLVKAGSMRMPEFPPLVDYSSVPGKTYFVYEHYRDALPLRRILMAEAAAGQEGYNLAFAVTICKKIAAALHNAWKEHGIIHQNLTPDNIFILKDGTISIQNVGISEFLSREKKLISYGFNIWDYRYSAPEFLNNGISGPSNDVYSLGGILYFLLTDGHHPFENTTNPKEIDVNNLFSEKYCSSILDSLSSLVKTFMNPDFQQRPLWTDVLFLLGNLPHSSTEEIMAQTTIVKRQISLSEKASTGAHAIHGQKPGDFKRTERYPIPQKQEPGYKNTDTLVKLVLKKDVINTLKKQNQFLLSSAAQAQKFHMARLVVAAVVIVCVCVAAIFIFTSGRKKQEDNLVAENQIGSDLKTTQRILDKSELEISPYPLANGKKPSPKIQPAAEKTATAPPSQKTGADKIFEDIKSQAEKMIQKGQCEEAAQLLLDYKGEFENETRIRRFDLAMEIQNNLLTATAENREKNREKLYSEIMPKTLALISQNKIAEAIEYLKGEKQKAPDLNADNGINYLQSSLETYNKLKSDNQVLKKNTEIIIADNKELLDKYPFAAGLLLFFDGKTKSADEFFARCQTPLAEFIAAESNKKESPFAVLSAEIRSRLANLTSATASAFDNDIVKAISILKTEKEAKPEYKILSEETDSLLASFELYKKIKFDDKNAGKTIETLIAENQAALDNSPITVGLLFWEKEEIKNANEAFAKLAPPLSEIFHAELPKREPEQAFSSLLRPFGISFDKANPQSLLGEILKTKITADKMKEMRTVIESFRMKYPDSSFVNTNSGLLDEILKICDRELKKTGKTADTGLSSGNEIIVSAPAAGSADSQILEALGNAKPNVKIILKEGIYNIANKMTVMHSDFSFVGEGKVDLNGHIKFGGKNITIQNINQTSGQFVLSEDAKNISFKNCCFYDSELRIEKAEKISLENCIFRGLYIEEGKDLEIKHCSVLSSKYGLDAALSLRDVNDFKISDSLIYSNRYAVSLTAPAQTLTKEKDRIFSNTLVFGEEGAFVCQDSDGKKKEFIEHDKISKAKRYFNLKNKNIFTAPVFQNSAENDWNLVEKTPGYKGASDGKNCGAIITK
jgi:serine/threonine protein kinase